MVGGCSSGDACRRRRGVDRDINWCGWRGSNPRPLASEANTLSTELQPQAARRRIVEGLKRVDGYNRRLIPTCQPIFEDTMSDNSHEEDHTGPIKTPKQLLMTVFFSFVAPVFIIIGLVYFVVSQNKPAAGSSNPEKSVAQRIQKVGSVEIRDANRELKSGEEVFKVQCTACHTSGAAGAPKIGDAAAWGPRIATGYERCSTRLSRARMPWPPRVVVTSKTSKSAVPWSTWPTPVAPSSKRPRPPPPRPARQRQLPANNPQPGAAHRHRAVAPVSRRRACGLRARRLERLRASDITETRGHL